MADSVELVIDEIGFGRWQGLVLAVASLTLGLTPVQQLSSPLLSAPVPFHCSIPKVPDTYITKDNKNEFTSECLTTHAIDSAISYHRVHLNSSKQKLTGLALCPIVEYNTSVFKSTVITEWNLICDSSNLRPLFQMAYGFGGIVASLFTGQLSDGLGRKRALQIGSILVMVSVLATSLVPWYFVMIIMRALSGIGTVMMVFPAYTILSEMTPSKQRAAINVIPGFVYFVGEMFLAGIANVETHWRRLLLIANSPLLLLVPLCFIMNESPRWLLQKGRLKEAAGYLKAGVKMNKVKETSIAMSKIDILCQSDGTNPKPNRCNEEEVKALGVLKTCLTSPGLRNLLLRASLLWFLLRALFMGIIIDANNFTSSNPINYIIMTGVAGMVSMVLYIPASTRFSRRVFLVATLSMSGLLMLATLVVPQDLWTVRWVLVMTSFLLAASGFQLCYTYTAELFPTVIRTRCYTFTNLAGSAGEMVIPVVTDILVQYIWWASSVTFSLAGIAGSLLVFLLPETKDLPLPDTLQDVEDRYLKDHKGAKSDNIMTGRNHGTSTLTNGYSNHGCSETNIEMHL